MGLEDALQAVQAAAQELAAAADDTARWERQLQTLKRDQAAVEERCRARSRLTEPRPTADIPAYQVRVLGAPPDGGGGGGAHAWLAALLVAAWICLALNGPVERVLFAGDFLGLANNETYAYSAEAVTHVALCRFPRRQLEALLERYPKMERRLLGMASHELAAAQEQMLLLGRKTAREKIASFLLTLSRRARKRGQRDNPVAVPMSRTDIGDFLGLTTETVSRTFTQLKTAKLIVLLPNGKVELADLEALQEIAEGN